MRRPLGWGHYAFPRTNVRNVQREAIDGRGDFLYVFVPLTVLFRHIHRAQGHGVRHI